MSIIGVLIIFFLLFVLIYAMSKFVEFTKGLLNKDVRLLVLAKLLVATVFFSVSFKLVTENAESLGIKVTQPNEVTQKTT